jgi:hypothetical protein
MSTHTPNSQLIQELPPLAGVIKSLRVAILTPGHDVPMTADSFIFVSDRLFRWPLTPMQYIILGETIAMFTNIPIDEVLVIGVDPLAPGHTAPGETANELSLPERFFENNRPPYEPYQPR